MVRQDDSVRADDEAGALAFASRHVRHGIVRAAEIKIRTEREAEAAKQVKLVFGNTAETVRAAAGGHRFGFLGDFDADNCLTVFFNKLCEVRQLRLDLLSSRRCDRAERGVVLKQCAGSKSQCYGSSGSRLF